MFPRFFRRPETVAGWTGDELRQLLEAVEHLQRIQASSPLNFDEDTMTVGCDIVSALGALPPNTIISTTTLEFIDTTTPANFITVEAPTGLTPYTIVWPGTAGSAGQVLDIVSNVGGVLTLAWVTPASGPVAGTLATFPQWLRWKITVTPPNFVVTNPDGTTTNTALAAAVTQTLTLTNPAPVSGTAVTQVMHSVPTGFTGAGPGPTASVGYSGGDTTNSGSAAVTTAYVASAAILAAYTRRTSDGVPASQGSSPSNIGAWSLTATFTSNANWTAATAGEFDVWLLMGNAP